MENQKRFREGSSPAGVVAKSENDPVGRRFSIAAKIGCATEMFG